MGLDLPLIHGRHGLAEQMEEWGFKGLTLGGIEAIHVTYRATYVLHFEDPAAADHAYRTTGWRQRNENPLEIEFFDDI